MSVQKLCLFFTYILLVIDMESTQNHHSTLCVELPTPIEIKAPSAPKRIETYDKASAEFRRHLASEAAIRQLEQRKAVNGALVHRMSFMR